MKVGDDESRWTNVLDAIVAIAGYKRASDAEKKSCLVTLLFKNR
jgi:hypothetical protein